MMRSGAAACVGALFLVAAADQGTSDAPLDHDLESLVELEHDLGRVGKEPGVNTYKDDMTAAKSVIEGQISSMAQAIAEAVQRSDSVTQMVSQTTGAAIAHLVPELLTRVVTGSLSHELAPLISDKVNELATPAVTDVSKLFVLDTMPARSGVPEELTKRLVATLGPALERFSRGELAHRIAAEVLRDVGHLVAGSIGQAVAPAVTVAITRSPQSDYFCYYCLKENLFCEYCSLAPGVLQLALCMHIYFVLTSYPQRPQISFIMCITMPGTTRRKFTGPRARLSEITPHESFTAQVLRSLL